MNLIHVIVFLAAMQPESPPELPTPPSDFDWAWCAEVNVGLLKPKLWHFKKTVEGKAKAYFVTKENIDKNGAFQTGLTLNVLGDTRKKSGTLPSAYAANFIETAAKTKEVLKKWTGPPGLVKSFGCLVRDGEKGKGVKVHHFLVADDREEKRCQEPIPD